MMQHLQNTGIHVILREDSLPAGKLTDQFPRQFFNFPSVFSFFDAGGKKPERFYYIHYIRWFAKEKWWIKSFLTNTKNPYLKFAYSGSREQ